MWSFLILSTFSFYFSLDSDFNRLLSYNMSNLLFIRVIYYLLLCFSVVWIHNHIKFLSVLTVGNRSDFFFYLINLFILVFTFFCTELTRVSCMDMYIYTCVWLYICVYSHIYLYVFI